MGEWGVYLRLVASARSEVGGVLGATVTASAVGSMLSPSQSASTVSPTLMAPRGYGFILSTLRLVVRLVHRRLVVNPLHQEEARGVEIEDMLLFVRFLYCRAPATLCISPSD